MAQGQEQWEQVRSALQVRIAAYDILRRTFSQEPSPNYLKAISEPGFIEGFPFSGENKMIRAGIRQVAACIQQQDTSSLYDKLQRDYTQLFIGPHSLPAPPWESVYLSEERLLFQNSTLEVRHIYAKYGFRAANYRREADDHLGLELDFMYQLAHLAGERDGKYPANVLEVLQDSRSFLATHLANWVPVLVQDILQHAQTDFYQGMAVILDGYLQIDLEILDELITIWKHCNQPEVKCMS